MEQPKWNEGRLDDLSKRVDTGFERMDDEFTAVRSEMKEGFEKVDNEFKAVRKEMKEGFETIDMRFERVGDRLDRLHLTLITAGAVIAAAVITAPHL